MSIRTHHVAASFFAVAIALSSLAWLGLQAPNAIAACGPGATITMAGPPAGTVLTGSQVLTASTSGSSAVPSSVTILISAPTQQVLGQITGPSGTYSWPLPWDSRTVVDGSYQFMAIAHYGTNTAYDCPSVAVPYTVHNSTTPTQSPTLSVNVAPITWQGVPGQQAPFNASGVYTNQFGTQYPVNSSSGATFAWGTNAGSLSNTTQPSTVLTDGPATGSFSLGVSVTMNGLNAHATSTVKIVAPTTTTTSGNGTGGTTATPPPSPSGSASPSPKPASGITTTTSGTPIVQLTPQQIQQLQSTPTIFRPATATNSNPIVAIPTLGCLQQTLGAKYTGISSGVDLPTSDERLKAAQCFSGSDRIPAKLAPVEPARIDDVPPETAFVKLSGVKGETITNSKGTKVAAILLSGTGAPNTSVFLYIFSDPMVLRAQTDSQGKWSYVLQNPLKPGEHKIYAVAQKDSDNFVRTPAVPIAIAAASNSQDGSLVIEHTWQPAQIAYVAGAAVMVIAGIFLLFRIRRRTPPVATNTGGLVQTATAPAAPAPAAPAAAIAPTQRTEPTTQAQPAATPPTPPAQTTPEPPSPDHDAQT